MHFLHQIVLRTKHHWTSCIHGGVGMWVKSHISLLVMFCFQLRLCSNNLHVLMSHIGNCIAEFSDCVFCNNLCHSLLDWILRHS
jgi:hypothetical protein